MKTGRNGNIGGSPGRFLFGQKRRPSCRPEVRQTSGSNSILAVLLALIFATGCPLSAYAQDEIVVIVRADEPVDSLSYQQLREIFLGTKQVWHDVRAHPAYVKPEATVHLELFHFVLGMAYPRYQRYWLEKTFSGSGFAPAGFRTPEAVIEFVCTTSGSIGFIRASSAHSLERCKILPLI